MANRIGPFSYTMGWGNDAINLLNKVIEYINKDASETDVALLELATTGEATTGTDTTRAVTPAGLKAAIDAAIAAIPSVASVQTGTVFDYVGSSAPSGYVFLDGKTIGNASSGATSRANADTSNLFTLLWNSMADAQAPVSTGRGASAAADFAANKTITLPDARGRVIAGQDDMGGTSANRLVGTLTGSLDGDILGNSGGEEGHKLTVAELAAHTHTYNDRSFALRTSTGVNTAVTAVNTNTGSTGGDQQHNNVQPTLVLNKIIKL
ncbi:MAG: hypothetical protein A4E20_04785 [Nitrospira sp. SG-bin2]|uniref:phage tail protein n=1 Tax=Nitrospira cf. moscoviensis SBR1015 TaxID=96242 RepID=UPI000A0CFEB8|nr:hypothetical protein [Nitrospira cf. moscoviensis SBR1015]OQW38093.1 MAG: hypothetical protein A4E20_04785 [Nitrospira sp. SG-bin2]